MLQNIAGRYRVKTKKSVLDLNFINHIFENKYITAILLHFFTLVLVSFSLTNRKFWGIMPTEVPMVICHFKYNAMNWKNVICHLAVKTCGQQIEKWYATLRDEIWWKKSFDRYCYKRKINFLRICLLFIINSLRQETLLQSFVNFPMIACILNYFFFKTYMAAASGII